MTSRNGATAPSLRLRARHLWRTRLRAQWQSVRLPLLAVAAVAVLVLGYIGFARVHPPLPGQGSFWDRLQLAMQLFVLQSGAIEQDVPLSLDIARLLAPVIAGLAAIIAVVALFREQMQLGFVRTFNGHVVIAGLSEKGFQLARTLHDAGRRVVAIEREPTNALIEACQERGVPVLRGDAADRLTLKRAGLERARHLVVTCGDDATNVSVAFAAGPFAANRRRGVLTAAIHLDDRGLWPLLTAEILARRERSRLRLAPFNLADIAARKLLDDHPPLDEARPHLLIVGVGELSEWLVLHTARRWRHGGREPGDLLRVTLADVDAPAWLSVLEAQHPQLRAICQLAARDVDVANAELDWSKSTVSESSEWPVTHAYVTLPREADGLAAAIALRAHWKNSALPIVLVANDEDAGVATALRSGAILQGVTAFGLLSRTMTPRLLTSTPNEILARATHEHYVQSLLAKGESPEENDSLRQFEELPESLKESNRRFADGIGEKLEVLDCTLLPAPLAGLNGGLQFTISAEELEALAKLEHDRWCSDLLDDGWHWGEPKDPEKKLHPNLVEWSALSESDRDKDRDAVSALPQILALAGFDIVRRGEAATAPGTRSELPLPGEVA